jgi:hypothetical protein
MRFIPTRVHGILDYLVGALLIAAPWIFGFVDNGGAKMWVPIILGASAIVYSLLTDYEWGAIHAIPMSAHLVLDFLSGVVLAASPWLFGFSDEVKWPHVLVGLFEIGASLMTRTHPEREERQDYTPPSTTRMAH